MLPFSFLVPGIAVLPLLSPQLLGDVLLLHAVSLSQAAAELVAGVAPLLLTAISVGSVVIGPPRTLATVPT